MNYNYSGTPNAGVVGKPQIRLMKKISERVDTPSSYKIYLMNKLENAPANANFVDYLYLGFSEFDGQGKHFLDLMLWTSEKNAAQNIDKQVYIDNKMYFVSFISPKHTKIYLLDTARIFN